MLKYEYTDADRLQSPHKYMYAPYQGGAFIGSYFSDREANLRRFKLQEPTQELAEIERYLCESSILLLTENCCSVADESVETISYFDKKTRVITEELMTSLIVSQFSNDQNKRLKDWIDFLVQRFEVTKKLYEIYHSNNLRKGEGEVDNVRLYWLFSLLLTLYYSGLNNIKYLSTLLKVNDLICSLDDDLLSTIPKQGLVLVLSKEMESISAVSSNINGELFCI
jgi:hypothetical protein